MTGEQTVLEAKRLGVFHCQETTLLEDAARQMFVEDISALVIIDQDGCLEGILTRTDLLRALVEREDWPALPVSMYMSREVVTVGPHATLQEVANLLLDMHIHRVVVIRSEGDKRVPLAVVSATDLIYHMTH